MLVDKTLTGMTAGQFAAQPKPPPSRAYNPMGVGWPSSQPARATSGPSPDMAAYAPKQPQGGYSAYTPGMAQPTQTQSQGTPYGQPANPYANMQPGVYQNGQMIPGDMTSAINTAMQRNAATAHLYNQAQAPYSFFGNAMGMDLGAPQNNPQAMFQQAQEMVNAGWQNPLQRYFDEADTAQRLAQQAPPSMYSPAAGLPGGNDAPPPNRFREPAILVSQGGSDQRRPPPAANPARPPILLAPGGRATPVAPQDTGASYGQPLPRPSTPAPQPVPQRPIPQPSILTLAPPRTPEEAARRDYEAQLNAAYERQRGPIASNPYATPVTRDGRMYEAAPRKGDPNYDRHRNYMNEQAAREQAQYQDFRKQYEARNPFGQR